MCGVREGELSMDTLSCDFEDLEFDFEEVERGVGKVVRDLLLHLGICRRICDCHDVVVWVHDAFVLPLFEMSLLNNILLGLLMGLEMILLVMSEVIRVSDYITTQFQMKRNE